MESTETRYFVPFVLTTAETEKETPIKDAEPQISKSIEFTIQFIAADMDKKGDEEIIGLTKAGWPFWTFIIDTNYGYFIDGLQIASTDIQITSPPNYSDLKKPNVEMDKYVSTLKDINSELSKRKPKKEKMKITGFLKQDFMELISFLFTLVKKPETKEAIPLTPIISQNAAAKYTKELSTRLSSIEKNLQEFKELKQEILTKNTNWVENIDKTSKIQEENYDVQIDQMTTTVNQKISEYTTTKENKIHQLNEETQEKINREINLLREELEPHINVLRCLYVEVRDTFKEIKEERFVESILKRVGTMIGFAKKDAKKIEDIVQRIDNSYENSSRRIDKFNEECETKKEQLEKEYSEKIEMEKEKVAKLKTEKQKKLEELKLLKQKLLKEVAVIRETLDTKESTLQSTKWTPTFLFQPEWIEKVKEKKLVYVPLVLIKYAKKGDRNSIRLNVRLPIVIDLGSTEALKEQINSVARPIQKNINVLNRILNDKIKGDQKLYKILNDAFSELNFIADETKKEALSQGLIELKEKNLINEETGEYYKKQFDEIIQREFTN